MARESGEGVVNVTIQMWGEKYTVLPNLSARIDSIHILCGTGNDSLIGQYIIHRRLYSFMLLSAPGLVDYYAPGGDRGIQL